MMKTELRGKNIILGIGGGIAAYKCCDLVRRLIECDASVHVILTEGAQHFVTPLTLQTLSQHPVHTDLFDLTQESDINHTSLATTAHMVLIAPATADIIAKISTGLCSDLLTTVVCATKAPVLFAPSMNTNMWTNPITQRNVTLLKSFGYAFLDPVSGDLACGMDGMGRLPETQAIVTALTQLIS